MEEILLMNINTIVRVTMVCVCTDIDECEDGTDSCGENADCTNTDGSYTCSCLSGYSGDGMTCDGKDLPKQVSGHIRCIHFLVYRHQECLLSIAYDTDAMCCNAVW